MSPDEVLWLSGLLFGAALGIPAGILLDQFLLRPSARAFRARRPIEHDRSA
jgi:hypothetical protein